MKDIAISQGSATRVTLLVNDREVEFKLTIVDEPSEWHDDGRTERQIAYVNADERTYLLSGCYSGGATGCGCEPSDIKPLPTGTKIVTQKVDEILLSVQEVEAERDQSHKNFLARQRQRVEAINNLPETVELGEHFGMRFWIERGTATFNPAYSSKIQWSTRLLVRKPGNITYPIFLTEYFTNDGKVKSEKFRKHMGLEGNFLATRNTIRTLLFHLKKTYENFHNI